MEDLIAVIWPAAVAVWLYMTTFYLLGLAGKNASIVDTGWGIGFVLITTVVLGRSTDISSLQLLVHLLVTLWGLRLAAHVFLRNAGRPEDWRYANWRKEWGKTYLWRSYLQIFMLQGLLMLLIAAPVYLSALEPGYSNLSPLAYIGAMIWLVGFLFETIGDYQLRKYIKDGKTKGRIMRYGLWKYTRHPNYFGEVTQWWGLFIAVAGAPYWWLGIISPAIITFLMIKVSGIAMLEKRWDGVKEYQEYKKVTSAFFPLPPKKS